MAGVGGGGLSLGQTPGLSLGGGIQPGGLGLQQGKPRSSQRSVDLAVCPLSQVN